MNANVSKKRETDKKGACDMTGSRKNALFFNICLFLFLSLSLPALPYPVMASVIEIPEDIRVAVTDNAQELSLSIKGPYEVRAIETGELLDRGKTFFNIRVEPSAYGIVFGDKEFKIYGIHIIPKNQPAVYLGKCLYRGSLQIVRTRQNLLRAINVVALEDYLKGVLYHEISHRWPMEAIKAQAIVSRTFALYQAQQNKTRHYYLKSDVSSQMYRGVYAEKHRTNRAVDKTRAGVLVWKGKLLPAFFHATCGGHTENVRRLWSVNAGPLKGVKCGYCENSPHLLWECSLSLLEIEMKLNRAGYKVSQMSSIGIKGRDRSGRIIELILKGETGSTRLRAKDFRNIIGARTIRSTNFTVDVTDNTAHFQGRGWGHGVGMCQWGAFSMAKKGKTAEQILSFYYPGARVVKLEQ